jgi:hypothetical protein
VSLNDEHCLLVAQINAPLKPDRYKVQLSNLHGLERLSQILDRHALFIVLLLIQKIIASKWQVAVRTVVVVANRGGFKHISCEYDFA